VVAAHQCSAQLKDEQFQGNVMDFWIHWPEAVRLQPKRVLLHVSKQHQHRHQHQQAFLPAFTQAGTDLLMLMFC
jgi:hypothetical protein